MPKRGGGQTLGGSVKLLVADDDALARALLRDALRDWDGEVVFARDGIEAWATLQAPDPPRLAVLDWVMPGMNGPAICQLVHRYERPFTYLVLATGRDAEADVVRGLEAGAHDFVSKPLSIPVLRARLEVGRRLVQADDKVKRFAARMEALASTDPLTGLANRRHFLDAAGRELRRAARHGHPTAVLLFDLDHFKRVNDVHGHEVGDRLLYGVAEALNATLRAGDACGRLGGEEFAVLLPETGLPGAVDAAERVRAAVAAVQIEAETGVGRATASVGVAVATAGEVDLGRTLRRADAAMYAAKRSGRNRVVVAAPTLAEDPGRAAG